jgi:FkbM family methyltransferase
MAASISSKVAEETVQLLYRALLGRGADTEGLRHYTDLLVSGDIDEESLANALLGSPEYRRRADTRTNLAGHDVAKMLECSLLVPANPGLVAELESAAGYEPWVLPYFLDQCRPGGVVLDVGASVGAFALPAARRVGPEGVVYAVEAAPLNCRLLAQSIALNRLDNVVLLPVAISDVLGHAQMLRQSYTNNNVLEPDDEAHLADLHSHDVIPVVPLDLLRSALRPVDLIKMDIEGMEYRATKGAITLIKADRPIVFLEYSPHFQRRLSGVSGETLIKLFQDLGYTFEILHRDRPRQIVTDADLAAAIDAAWAAHVKDGGSHLDLCMRPS